MKINYGEQWISEEDIESVVSALKSEMITQGPIVEKFEVALSKYTGSKNCKVFNSATSALHAACLALGLGEGDVVWTSPNTFVATANVAHMCGANVNFIDINIKTRNLDPNRLETQLKLADKNSCLPNLVIPVHFSGLSCDMEAIKYLSNRYGFKILEDASHAIGAEYNGKKIGSCIYSDITVFSFHPVKIITTGEGGAALTNNNELARKLDNIRSHGVVRNKDKLYNQQQPSFYYEMQGLGFNYRMTDLQAALGLSQLSKLDMFISKRDELARHYELLFADHEFNQLIIPDNSRSSHHLYTLCVNNRNALYSYMHSLGIKVNVHYIPVHLHPYWANMGFRKGDFPNAESYYERAITLPLHPKLQLKEIEIIASEFISFLR